ncbi:DUF4369 domain-containing protein [Psychroserpens sp.]|uniref:DUF4369 domain-containing protein n=1 Tax=Psychroserpens sp. TaxID=2020870 RepID=UPI001B1CB42C|nr:DUF4369 domain-containing protein [Psychroserpens sp.]MBO6606055.1 DUF4369 domain-containing protein [Psychroserpens sp.]MBO6630344.1 DUF4369 domain-containing protein [Psychroserpens sp.]MBO6652574.1 DUF4369 domain-containing protein [Psychroserpens sp.]MBO6681654.1 DUF4369 domain-containing protein [Psychroserpens sp.]MBO6749429.1 DUF4369 domain-containing protein [Psychroserpens sp.]
MKQLFNLLAIVLLIACGQEEPQHDFTLKGHVKGLKKGTVYLQRQQDTMMVTLDSLEIQGEPNFELHYDLEEPEVLFLRLDKNDNDEGTVAVFANTGVTEVNTTLKNFNYDAVVKGSKQQEVLEEYLVMMSKFNDRNLEIIQESLEASKANDTTVSFEENYNKLLRRKYLYTINFAVNNKDSEVAPYLAISEIPDTSVKFLEEIYDALTDDIKNSKYGVQLKDLIALRKEN